MDGWNIDTEIFQLTFNGFLTAVRQNTMLKEEQYKCKVGYNREKESRGAI